ncbi:MAG: hypothetical protein PHV11_00295 [Candidatus Bipolaricaulis sp.]|nr:hypothetical protein [Candidatus Bipolaricaulis sp.]
MTSKYQIQTAVLQDMHAKMGEILTKKGNDYSTKDDRFSNFNFSALIIDTAVENQVAGPPLAFLSLISTKLARLIELCGSGKVPQNEAIEDTLLDLANYALLWGAWHVSQQLGE